MKTRCMPQLALFLAAGLVAAAAGTALAKPITLACDDKFGVAGAKMTIVYEGAATGTLKVTSAFGSFSLSAIRSTSAGDDDGKQGFGVRGGGKAKVAAPERAALEACEAKRIQQDAIVDGIVDVLPGDPCLANVPRTPAELDATVSFALDRSGSGAGDLAMDAFLLRYPEKSAPLNAYLRIGMVPPPACVVN